MSEIRLDDLALIVVQPGEGDADSPCQLGSLGVVGANGRLASVPTGGRPISAQAASASPTQHRVDAEDATQVRDANERAREKRHKEA